MYDKYHNENSEQTKIFDVAIKLMEDVGYEGLSIRNICNKAGISIGKFYLYFQNKQDLLCHYYMYIENVLRKDLADKFVNMDLKSQIIEFYRAYMEYTASLGIEFVINYFNPHNEMMDIFNRTNFIMEMTDQFMEDALKKGYIFPKNKGIHQLSMEICMIIKGIIFTWSATHGAFSLSDMTVNILGAALDGILPGCNQIA